ncbi:MAG TPA: ECF transporter S component [Actinomycetota bacterium]|nr:ECF transporter S component [Actinomycetota bacterium]
MRAGAQRWVRRLAFIVVNAAGVAAFCWPLLLGTRISSERGAHAGDAPVLLALAVPLLILVAVTTARRSGDARLVALLGALVAVNSVLRIPKGPSGESLVFVLPVLAGWTLGAGLAFLLGAFTMLVSGVMTGGVGPWLPFQMFALGWVGAGAGILAGVLRGRMERTALGVYAGVSSFAYGLVMTLWFWPFLADVGPVSFQAGAGMGETLSRFLRFYTLTSLPWDVGRAILVNVPLVVLLARPVGILFARTRERLTPQIASG